MIVTPCPKCKETFRLPVGTLPEDALAVCPWCKEHFALAEVVDHLPPILGVVGADGNPIDLSSPDSGGELEELEPQNRAVEAETATEPWTGLSVDDREVVTADQLAENWNSGNDQSTFDSAEPVSQDPILMRPHSRPRRKSSGIRTAIGVVLGGLAALPIAGGILMLLGKTPNWGFWPFDGSTQNSGPGVIVAPPGDLGERSYDRPFGQSLMNSERSKISPNPSDAVLDSILNPDQSTSPPSELTEDPGSESPAERPSQEDGKDPAGQTTVPGSGKANSASVSQAEAQTEPTATLDAITLLNPDFDPTNNLEPAPTSVEGQAVATIAPDPIAAVERLAPALTLPPQSSFPPPPNISDPAQGQSTEEVIAEDSQIRPEEAIQSEIETPVVLNSPAPELQPASTPVTLNETDTAEPVTLQTAGPEDSLSPLTSPVLEPRPQVDSPNVPAADDKLQVAEGKVEVPREPENTEMIKDEAETITSDANLATTSDEVPESVNALDTTAPKQSDLGSTERTSNDEPKITSRSQETTASPQDETIDSATTSESNAIEQSTRVAKDMVNRLTTFDGTKKERRVLLRDTYLKIAEVCDAAPSVDDTIRDLAKTIAISPVIDEVEMAGLDWLEFNRRKLNGVAVVGEVSQRSGTTTLRLGNGNTLTLTPNADLPLNTKVLTLGQIMDDSTVKTLAVEPIQ